MNSYEAARRREQLYFWAQIAIFVASFWMAFALLDVSAGWAIAIGLTGGLGAGHLIGMAIGLIRLVVRRGTEELLIRNCTQ